MPEYYVRRDDQIFGPLSTKQLKQGAALGQVQHHDQISTSKQGPWHLAKSVPNLFPDPEPEQQPPESPPSTPTADEPEEFGWNFENNESEAEIEDSPAEEGAYEFQVREPATNERDEYQQQDRTPIGRELIEEIAPRVGMPREIKELITEDEEILFADHPSKVVLIVRCAIVAFVFLVPAFPVLFLGDNSIVMLGGGLLLACLWLYLIYGSWVNTFYVITGKRGISRDGWFNRSIKIIPLHNIQEISINTGLIDRWFNLNTILFASAASSSIPLPLPLPMVGQTGIQFRSVNSRTALKALQRAG